MQKVAGLPWRLRSTREAPREQKRQFPRQSPVTRFQPRRRSSRTRRFRAGATAVAQHRHSALPHARSCLRAVLADLEGLEPENKRAPAGSQKAILQGKKWTETDDGRIRANWGCIPVASTAYT